MDTLSRLTAAGLALILSASAWAVDAQTNASPFRPTVTYPSGMGGQAVVVPARIQGGVSAAEFGRVWGPALANIGDVTVIDTVPDAKVGGVPATIKSTRTIPWKGIAAGAAAFAPTAVGVGLAVKELWDAYHCDLGLGKCDEGRPPEPKTDVLWWGSYGEPCAGDSPGAYASCAVLKNKPNQAPGGVALTQGPSCTLQSPTSAVCTWRWSTYWDDGSLMQNISASDNVLAREKTVTRCPAVIDPLDPSKSYPEGHDKTPDGKCRTGRYSTPNPGSLAPRFEGAPDSLKERAPDIGKDIAERGIDLTPHAGPQSLSGPDKVPGTPSSITTTGPNGEPQTTTKTPVHNVTYNTQTNYYSWTTVTTTTNNYGAPTTVEEKPPDDIPPTDCEVNPEAIGCQKLGPLPEVAEIPKVEVPVAIAPDSGWGAATGSCPSPKTITVLGQSMQLSWEPVCDFANGIRWIVIALASMSAAWILMGANQKEGD